MTAFTFKTLLRLYAKQAQVSAFNQEKAQVEAFSVIGDCDILLGQPWFEALVRSQQEKF